MPIHIKRAYDPIEPNDGQRVLVDRLWPRGVTKDALALDLWLKEAGPSSELRKWFGHDPNRWPEFRKRYFTELDERPGVTRQLLDLADKGKVTLLYGTRDHTHNQAVALKDYLDDRRHATRGSAQQGENPRDADSESPPDNRSERRATTRRAVEPSTPDDEWDRVLQASWESFPASDAPGWR